MMATIHSIMQGKGGVGKSVIAALIAQYLIALGRKPLCIDTDPVNATFHGYKALNVHRLEILEGNEINPRRFDDLVDLVAGSHEDIIIDNGASTFVPLAHYLITNDIPAMFKDMHRKLVIHTVITGGQALRDTVSGFSQMAAQFPGDAVFMVWLNPFWGPIEHEGKGFEEMKACKQHRSQIEAILEIPAFRSDMAGRDLSDMLRARRTFDESLQDAALPIMVRQRLKIARDRLFQLCDTAGALS